MVVYHRAALESYWKEMSRSIGVTISNSRYFKGFNKFLSITDSMIVSIINFYYFISNLTISKLLIYQIYTIIIAN